MAIPDTIYLNVPIFLLGLLIILRSSDLFLANAVWMARASGISQVVIGATVVSFCTTLPELVSSSAAAFRGTADMAIGNAVGSIICNTGLILGAVLLLATVRIKRETFLIKGAFMVGSILVLLFLVWPVRQEPSYVLTRFEGFALLVILMIFVIVNYYESQHTVDVPQKKRSVQVASAVPVVLTFRELARRLVFFAVGAAGVAFGAYLLVEYGQRLARNMGISEAVISLLFIALGTSLPELFTGISAVRKNAQAVSIGNIFGANVLNIIMVVGTAAVINPLRPRDTWLIPLDLPVALALCATVFAIGLVTGRLGRKTGICLVTMYALYMVAMVALGRIG